MYVVLRKQNDNTYFVLKSQRNRITVSQSKGTAHQQPGPVGELSGHVSIQTFGPGFTLAPSSGCCVLMEDKQMPPSSCPSPCPCLGTESRQS